MSSAVVDASPDLRLPFSAAPLTPKEPTRPGWTWHRLTDLARLATGHTPSRRHPEYWNGDIPWLQLPDIRALDGKVAYSTSERTNHLGLENSASVLLPKGTVCMSRTASVGFVTIMGSPMATSQDFVNWVCGPDLDPEFLMYLLIACRGPIRELGSGAVHHTIYFHTVESFSVCVPSVEQQKQIAAHVREQLTAAKAVREAAKERAAAAGALTKAYLRAAFEKLESRGLIEMPLGDIASLLPSKSISNAGASRVRAITSACLTEYGFSASGIKDALMASRDVEDCICQAGEVLVARSNTPELVGRASMYAGEPHGVVATDLTIRILPKPEMVLSGYLSTFLSYLFLTGYWREKAGGASGTMKKITREQLLALPVLLPSDASGVPCLESQRKLTDTLSACLSNAGKLMMHCREELAAIEALPAALLREAFGFTDEAV